MKTYYSDAKKNKAALILAAMSADMVRDIVHLSLTEGYSVLDTISDNDAPPRPFAMLSRQYISDSDFPEVFVGVATVMLGQFRTLGLDGDFYKKTLTDAFSMPDNMATAMAQSIETRDIIGGSKTGAKAMGWFERFTARTAEDIRRIANSTANLLGLSWNNDQDQQYDIDCLYELKKLGEAVIELQSRVRLTEGQANLAISMGLFKGYKGTQLYQIQGGDVDDDLDPASRAELAVLTHAQPLMGDILPAEVFGGLGKFVSKAREFAQNNLKGLIKKDDSGEGALTAQAYDNISAGVDGPSRTAELVRNGIPVNDLAEFLGKYMRAVPQAGDVANHTYARVAADYGPEIADRFIAGDLPGAFSEAIRIASGPLPSTGDTELDDQLTGDVFNEEDSVDTDPEVGGLFKKLRAKIKLKKARKVLRKKRRFLTRQNRRDASQQQLDAADQELAAAHNWQPDNQADADFAQQNFYTRLREINEAQDYPSFRGYGTDQPQDGMVNAVPATDGMDYFSGMPDAMAASQFYGGPNTGEQAASNM